MEKRTLLLKGAIVGISSLISNWLKLIGPAIGLLVILMVVDYISGMLASKKEAIEHPGDSSFGWSSRKSILGIYKKIGYVLTIFAAVCTDYLIFRLLEEIGVTYQTNTLFGLLVTIWFIINELLSLLENAGRMGVKLPESLKKVLSILQDEINKK
ncbi:MAG TPA: phage holin family protein [Candidatus Eisenbergiella merdavium]|uniref:Phage holin family protein n=1 Tax=Candidatus Eisenbergiella merdavium TaxID=2838551 RepID=A0A9D2SQ23_9FIRM|nr:phage holin family protein [Candidatus Eisenbergiella merdavium]